MSSSALRELWPPVNKDSGAPQGARDLTWSYGTVLGAMSSRKTLVDMMQEMSQQ